MLTRELHPIEAERYFARMFIGYEVVASELMMWVNLFQAEGAEV